MNYGCKEGLVKNSVSIFEIESCVFLTIESLLFEYEIPVLQNLSSN